MAEVTRVNGDAQAVVNVGTNTKNANSQIIATGVAGPLTAYRVEFTGNARAELGAGGLVEKALKAISSNASIVAYQIDAGSGAAGDLGAAISVLVERSGWTSNAAIEAVVQAQGGGLASATVIDRGFKLSRQ